MLIHTLNSLTSSLSVLQCIISLRSPVLLFSGDVAVYEVEVCVHSCGKRPGRTGELELVDSSFGQFSEASGVPSSEVVTMSSNGEVE